MPEMPTPQPLEAVRIDENSYRIEDNGVRSLLFIGTQRAMLIDAGFGSAGSLKAMVSSLTDKPVMLVITHADGDHIGCVHEFDCIYMHPSEMAYFKQSGNPRLSIKPLWEGEIIDLGGCSFEVVLIPGHTPGSIALLNREKRIIVTGDTISDGPVFMFGEVRSIDAYLVSVTRLIERRGEFDAIYPAHGPFPLDTAILDKTLESTKKLIAGELEGVEPPFPLPAKMYMYDGVGFFYDK